MATQEGRAGKEEVLWTEGAGPGPGAATPASDMSRWFSHSPATLELPAVGGGDARKNPDLGREHQSAVGSGTLGPHPGALAPSPGHAVGPRSTSPALQLYQAEAAAMLCFEGRALLDEVAGLW